MMIEIAICDAPLLRPTKATTAVMFILSVFSSTYLIMGLKKIFRLTYSILCLLACDNDVHFLPTHTISRTRRITERKMAKISKNVIPKFLNRSSLLNRDRPTFSPGLSFSLSKSRPKPEAILLPRSRSSKNSPRITLLSSFKVILGRADRATCHYEM